MNPFFGTSKTNAELQELLDKLQTMLASGVRQSTFKDQTLIFRTLKELQQNIAWLQETLLDRGALSAGSNSKAKKQIRFTSRNKGFA